MLGGRDPAREVLASSTESALAEYELAG